MKILVPVDTTVAYELVLYPACNPNDFPLCCLCFSTWWKE